MIDVLMAEPLLGSSVTLPKVMGEYKNALVKILLYKIRLTVNISLFLHNPPSYLFLFILLLFSSPIAS